MKQVWALRRGVWQKFGPAISDLSLTEYMDGALDRWFTAVNPPINKDFGFGAILELHIKNHKE